MPERSAALRSRRHQLGGGAPWQTGSQHTRSSTCEAAESTRSRAQRQSVLDTALIHHHCATPSSDRNLFHNPAIAARLGASGCLQPTYFLNAAGSSFCSYSRREVRTVRSTFAVVLQQGEGEYIRFTTADWCMLPSQHENRFISPASSRRQHNSPTPRVRAAAAPAPLSRKRAATGSASGAPPARRRTPFTTKAQHEHRPLPEEG